MQTSTSMMAPSKSRSLTLGLITITVSLVGHLRLCGRERLGDLRDLGVAVYLGRMESASDRFRIRREKNS